MDPRRDNMERLLATLGEAHQAGAFNSRAAGFPWQAERPVAQSHAHSRFAWAWIGGPLAAAAAVAVLFVGSDLFSTRVNDGIAKTVQTHLLPQRPEALAEVTPTTTSESSNDCRDYNGDGLVNGEDIQGYVDYHRDTGGSPEELQAFINRCLLDG